MREGRFLTDLKWDFALCDLSSRGSKRVAPILDTRHFEGEKHAVDHTDNKKLNSFLPPFLVRLQLKLLLFAPGDDRGERDATGFAVRRSALAGAARRRRRLCSLAGKNRSAASPTEPGR